MRIGLATILVSLGLLASDASGILSQSAVAETRVTIPSEGWTLIGDFTPGGAPGRSPAVLLLNGAARDRTAYASLARSLAARGVGSLRIDLRGHGESINLGRFEPGVSSGAILASQPDVAAALAWLRARPEVDPERIGVLGASYSGEDMAVVVRQGPAAAAYVALSPGSFSDESVAAIDRSGRPWLFIASTNERFAGKVVAAIPKGSGTAQIMFVDGAAHASDILGAHPQLNVVVARWYADRLITPRESRLFGSLERGPHAVGFRTESLERAGKTAHLAIWYPAAASEAPPMRLTDYLQESPDLRGAVEGFPSTAESLTRTLAVTISGDATGVASKALDELLASRFEARRNAAPAPGQFPVVLWTPRYATPAMQMVLSEFLAAHGFVVAFARPAGTAPMPFELATAAAREAELAARVDDMRTALGYLATRKAVNTNSVGVVAWSYTGEMATRFQASESSVRLVAGLSTNLLSGWVYQDGEASASIDSTRLTSAYAVLTQPRAAPWQPGLERVRGAAYFVQFPSLAHGSFNALEGYIPSLLGLTNVQRWSRSGPEGARGYEAAARILLRLLQHHVAGGSRDALPEDDLLAGIAPEVAAISRYRP
jgi:dienelactone hydrolase